MQPRPRSVVWTTLKVLFTIFVLVPFLLFLLGMGFIWLLRLFGGVA